jgi:serine/threonine-protein kinase
LRALVTGHPTDEGPHGARGLAGNSRDWCINVWRRDGPLVENGRARLDPAAPDDPDFRVIKGGAWGSTQHLSQAAARFGSPPGARKNFVGFRLARSYGPI